MGKSERPEHTAPPDVYYNAEEARKYTTNSRIMQIQVQQAYLLDTYQLGSFRLATVRSLGAQATVVKESRPCTTCFPGNFD